MPALDDISFQLGRLQSSVDTIVTRQQEHVERHEGMARDILDIKTTMTRTQEDVAEMKPQVEHYEKVRGLLAPVGAAVITAATALSGVVGGYIQKKWLS